MKNYIKIGLTKLSIQKLNEKFLFTSHADYLTSVMISILHFVNPLNEIK